MNLDIQLISLDSTDSTNRYAKDYLSKQTITGFTLITATEQKNGKGQFENKWESKKGENLTFSLLYSPQTIEAQQQFHISQAVALGIKKALDSIIDNVCIKWPNDIYAGHNKICGILIENQLMGNKINHTIIGVGLNVNQTVFESGAPNPTSMAIEKRTTFNLENIRNTVVSSIISHLLEIDVHQNINEIYKEYEHALFLKNRTALFVHNNTSFYARIKGVTAIGKLILEQSTEIKEYNLNEIKLAIPVQTIS